MKFKKMYSDTCKRRVISGLMVCALATTSYSGVFANNAGVDATTSATKKVESKQAVDQLDSKKDNKEMKSDKEQGSRYSLEQAMSDRAQLSTIAFSGLAFITGSEGADSFMPPGKVADFFGFQYMRDVDVAGYGHNTQFLTRIANNVLHVLDDEQKEKLITLATEQAPLYTQFAYNRFPLMKAFRDNLDGRVPEGAQTLDVSRVGEYTAALYEIDADLSYNRAVVMGEIINSLTDEQVAYFSDMEFNDFNTWPDVEEDDVLKRTMGHTEFVAVMTYASEMFSWYKGSIEADVYFCPERHGAYFGGFFMKDYPAMNNPDYFISTAVTGDKGEMFLSILNDSQRERIESIIVEQSDEMKEIAEIRTMVSIELRKAQAGETVDKTKVYRLIERYGTLDGELSALYANRFAEVNATLTDEQMNKLVELRDLDVDLQGAYMFSNPVDYPSVPDVDYLFGKGVVSEMAGAYTAPESFTESKQVQKLKPAQVDDQANDGNQIKEEGAESGEDSNRPPKPEGEDDSNRPPRPEEEVKSESEE